MSERELKMSRLGEAKLLGPSAAATPSGLQETSLVNVRSDDNTAKSWIVTLGRIERADRAPPMVPGGPGPTFNTRAAFASLLYPFAAGVQRSPYIFPVRTNPIYPINDAASGFVMVAWSMSNLGQANAHRFVADWPAMGKSFVVYGSYVEIWASGGTLDPVVNPGELPQYKASIVPSAGSLERANLTLTYPATLAMEAIVATGAGQDTGGQAAYIPDFAYRLKVNLTLPPTVQYPLLQNAPRWIVVGGTATLVWYDDVKRIVGSSLITDNDQWIDIPSRAVMAAVYSTKAADPAYFPIFQWQISP